MMTNMHFTPRKAATTLSFFLSVFLMAFSCQDHVVPDTPVAPEIQTLDLNVGSSGVTFKLAFTKIGEVPVTEYGTLYKVVEISGELIPTEADTKAIFTESVTLETKSKMVNLFIGGEWIFYRAYAKLANGTTIYGEVMNARLKTE
jgi:hypothetical protein